MKFRVTLDGRLSAASGALDAEAVRDALFEAMAELFKIGANDPNTTDPAIDATFDGVDDGCHVTITCCVDVADVDGAVPPASANIRSALHHAEIGTSQWPGSHDPRWQVEFINSRSEAVLNLT